MRILVTGCMGFIGSHVTRALLIGGHQVLGIDNLENHSLDPTHRMKAENPHWQNFDFLKADIRQFEVMMGLAFRFKPQAIVHLAALGSVPRSFAEPEKVIEVNEVGFANVMRMAAQLEVRKFVYASSSSVYGNHPSPVRIEGNEAWPTSPYALSKRQNEMFARIWGVPMGVPSIGLRFFNVYGPGQRPDSAYSAVIPKWLASEGAIKIHGDGSTIRDFTYVEDVSRAVIDALTASIKNRFAQVVNVGTGKGTTLNELARLVAAPVEHGPARPADVAVSIASPDFARELLGWSACVSLEEGIEITRKFYADRT